LGLRQRPLLRAQVLVSRSNWATCPFRKHRHSRRMVPISAPRIGRLGWKSDLRRPRAQGRRRAHLTNSLGSTRSSHSAPSKTDVALSGPPQPTDRRADKQRTGCVRESAREVGDGVLQGKLAGSRAQSDRSPHRRGRPKSASAPKQFMLPIEATARSGRERKPRQTSAAESESMSRYSCEPLHVVPARQGNIKFAPAL
jgi:hypothetical protein